MSKKILLIFIFCLFSLISCEDSDTDFTEPEVTLFDKTWVASTGVESIRYRLNSDGTYNGGSDEGFPNQGFWNWVDDSEEVMRIIYNNTILWYRFEDLTSNSVTTFISDVKPYEWSDGIPFSLSN